MLLGFKTVAKIAVFGFTIFFFYFGGILLAKEGQTQLNNHINVSAKSPIMHGLHKVIFDAYKNGEKSLKEDPDQMEVIVDLNQCVGDVNTSDIVKFISARGDITFTGTYLTFLIVVGIDAKEAMEIAGRSEVAMVELAEKQSWLGGNYRAAKVQTSGDYSPNTLQDAFGWSGTLNGSGINIAFLDTGVGAAYNGNYVYGYNAITDTVENPLSIPEDRQRAVAL